MGSKNNPGCDCCSNGICPSNCSDGGNVDTEAKVVVTGVANGGGSCSDCADLNATYFIPIDGETGSNCIWKENPASYSCGVTDARLTLSEVSGGIWFSFVLTNVLNLSWSDFPTNSAATPPAKVDCVGITDRDLVNLSGTLGGCDLTGSQALLTLA